MKKVQNEQPDVNPALRVGAVRGSLYGYPAVVYSRIGMTSSRTTIYGKHQEDAINRFYKKHPWCELLEVGDCP